VAYHLGVAGKPYSDGELVVPSSW